VQGPSIAEQIRKTLDSWLAAFNAKDTTTLFSLYDPNTVYANANAARMDGVAGLRPWYVEALEDPSLRVFFIEETLFESEDLAFIAGKYHFKHIQVGGRYEHGACGRVALLFRRAADGEWLLAYDIDNSPPDVTPADFN
jgi:ketosteroid isomerase-like protein